MNRRLLSFVSLFLVLALLSALAPAQVRPLAAHAANGRSALRPGRRRPPGLQRVLAFVGSSRLPPTHHAQPLNSKDSLATALLHWEAVV